LLVRSEEKGKPIKAKYPDVKLVYGGLTDSALVEQAAAEADVVVRRSLPTPGGLHSLMY
jgi:hypothetical protein